MLGISTVNASFSKTYFRNYEYCSRTCLAWKSSIEAKNTTAYWPQPETKSGLRPAGKLRGPKIEEPSLSSLCRAEDWVEDSRGPRGGVEGRSRSSNTGLTAIFDPIFSSEWRKWKEILRSLDAKNEERRKKKEWRFFGKERVLRRRENLLSSLFFGAEDRKPPFSIFEAEIEEPPSIFNSRSSEPKTEELLSIFNFRLQKK